MRDRISLEEINEKDEIDDGGRYHLPSPSLEFFSSGSLLLDCVLGGGWPLGRISNVVGSHATGKTAIAIEACKSFAMQYPKGRIKYRDPEAAFLMDYAESIAMPVDKIDFGKEDEPFDTVEDFFYDLKEFADKNGTEPGLYILDSLDAIVSAEEKNILQEKQEDEHGFSEGSYNTGKAKDMKKLFRMLARLLKHSRTHLMVISQEVDYIGRSFVKKVTRSGGRALDYFASQILWLTYTGTIDKTVNKLKRPIGIKVDARCTKNKISIPLQRCELIIKFGFGIDDFETCMNWLEIIGKENDILKDMKKQAYIKMINDLDDKEYWNKVREIGEICQRMWGEIEQGFAPKRQRI